MNNENARDLKSGVFAVKTDTVWGLGAWLDDEPGIRELMRIKERGPNDSKFFSLVLPEDDILGGKFVGVDDFAKGIVKDNHGKALTLVLPRSLEFDHWYFGALESVGVRFISSRVMQDIYNERGAYLLASANKRGGVPARSVEEIREFFGDIAVYGEDDGARLSGEPTTVAKLESGRVEILRQGEVAFHAYM
jgi:L-threonylcarbamoyladenylate synthase